MARPHLVFSLLLTTSLVTAGLAAGCGSSGASGGETDASTPDGGSGSGGGNDATFQGGDDVVLTDDASNLPQITSLTIQPQNPVIDVTIANGAVMSVTLEGDSGALPLAFHAIANTGAAVSASWIFDRGELGMMTAAGAFTPGSTYAGTGTVTASYGNVTATTTLSINIKATTNGNPGAGGGDAGIGDAGDAGAGDAGDGGPLNLGGNNGVGGNLLGGPVDGPTLARLAGPPTAPTSQQQFGWLYPYDKTVWPRGILAPLLQWETSLQATAVRIHLSEKNFDFVGTYAGVAPLINDPIDEDAWTRATNSNSGDPLTVEIEIDDGTTTYGPLTESWTVASGVLQGTVYYNSYDSAIVNGGLVNGQQVGSVLAIAPGATDPRLAVASTNTACYVCHTVSADGSTIIMQGPGVRNMDPPTLDQTSVYSLSDGGSLTTHYSDYSTANQDKPSWGALYPDGTMFLANSKDGFHAYGGNSDLFPTANADAPDGGDGGTGAIPTTGFASVVTQAVTPVFSPDGRYVSFSFFGGAGVTGVQPTSGQTLAMMSFDCGAGAGSVACAGNGPYAFSNLTLLDNEPNHYLGWPSFFPGNEGVVYQNTSVPPNGGGGSNLYTWNGAKAQIEWVNVPMAGTTAQPAMLNALNGLNPDGTGYLPTDLPQHGLDSTTNLPLDAEWNYEPTMNPIPTGGYYWVVFTSRRAYGNVLDGDPFANEEATGPQPFTKKLWIAAVDAKPTPGKDPSHPAFYLPGQELLAGNMRGYWVVSPCKSDGSKCSTGADCCGGFCEQGSESTGGSLVCGKTTPMGCSQEYESCKTASDCCDTNDQCIAGRCALPSPPPPPK
jgi:hypothetical protein